MPLASVDALQLTLMALADSPTAATLPGTEGGVVSAGGGGGGGGGGTGAGGGAGDEGGGADDEPPPPHADNTRLSDTSAADENLAPIRIPATPLGDESCAICPARAFHAVRHYALAAC